MISRRKVLIITYYWPPAGGGGVQRWVKFVKYLRDFGWEPIVFTVKDGSYPIIDDSLLKEIPMGLEVLQKGIFEPYQLYNWFSNKKSGAKIDANFLSQGKKLSFKDKIATWIRGNLFIPDARCLWIKPSAKYLLEYLKSNHVDAMISSGPPHSCHMIASRIKDQMNIPWIIDYRDPWTQIDFFEDLKLTYLARKRHESLEKKVLDQCDSIVTVGKTMASDLKSISSNRTDVITNGFDTEDRNVNERVVLDKQYTITYIGTMNDSRNPEVLWKALRLLKDENHEMMASLKVNMIGKAERIIQETIDKYEIAEFVDFVGYVSHNKAIDYQNSAQLLLLVINRTSNNKSILTGKIFEYIASGRPIICIGPQDGDAAEIILESESGVLVDYEDTEKMKQLLESNFAKYKTGSLVNEVKSIDKYSRKHLTHKLARLLDELSVSDPLLKA